MAVYLIRAGENGPVKIGTANDPFDRVVNLQTGNHEKLTLLRVWEGSHSEEAALHEMFEDLWIRGEWHGYSARMLGDVGLKQIFPAQPITKSLVDFAPVNSSPPPPKTLVDRLNEAFKAVGGVNKFADVLGIPSNTIRYWIIRERVPGKYCVDVERATGIPRHELRPDIFPAPASAETAAA